MGASQDAGEGSAAIEAGRKLGPYEVKRRIGAGGMGEVWQATDVRLGRPVAIKVLPREFTVNEDLQGRLENEARTISALSDPHICRIYDIGEIEMPVQPRSDHREDGGGVSTLTARTSTPYLVMEYLEGETLDQRIKRGPLPVEEVVRYGIEIAEALDSAHQCGIVHHDLKPSNIMITAQGTRLLDFGLAKHLQYGAEPEELADTEDLTASLSSSAAGQTAGTPAYMAPEQFFGSRADVRSDVYSLGLVLFEMLSGERAHDFEQREELIHSIISRDPRPPREINPTIPRELSRIVLKAIQRNIDDRYQSADELLADLRGFGGSQRKRAWRRGGWAVALGLLATIIAGSAWIIRFGVRPALSATPTMSAIVTWPTSEFDSRVSPDGEWVSFISAGADRDRVWIINLDGGEPMSAFEPEGSLRSHAWSPDGSEIAALVSYRDATLMQFVSPFGGGTIRRTLRLDPEIEDSRILRWTDSGISLEVAQKGLWTLDLSDDSFQRIIEPRVGKRRRLDFSISPDGRRIGWTESGESEPSIWVRTATSEPVEITPEGFAGYAPIFIGNDEIVFSSMESGQTDLWRTPIERPLPQQVTFSRKIERAEEASEDGRLLTIRETNESSYLWSLDPASGIEQQLTTDELPDRWPSFASGSNVLALQRGKPKIDRFASILDARIFVGRYSEAGIAGLRRVRDDGCLPALSPDGRWLAYVQPDEQRRFALHLLNLDSGLDRLISDQFGLPLLYPQPLEWVSRNMAWQPDSRRLWFVERPAEGSERLWTVLMNDPEPHPEMVLEGASITGLNPSADGKRLAFVRSDEARGAHEIVVRGGEGDETVLLRTSDGQHRLSIAGWAGSDQLIALEVVVGDDYSESGMIFTIDLEGRARTVGAFERAYTGTAVVDPDRNRLYLIGASAGGSAHNVLSIDLETGRTSPITHNVLPSSSFSGLQVLPDGRIIHTRHNRNEDIYLIQFNSN